MKISRTGKGIQGAIDALDNPKPFLEEAGKILQAGILARILFTKTESNGNAWPEWAAPTENARIRKGNAAQGLLYDEGNLARSIKWRVNGKQVEVGSDGSVPYAIWLQDGVSGRMPARPFIPTRDNYSRAEEGEIRSALVEHFRKQRK